MKLLAIFFGIALGSFWFGLWFRTKGSPEVRFFQETYERRAHDLEKLRESPEGSPVCLFAGGSSCAFSIAPEVIEENTGMQAINFGGIAGAGSRYLTAKCMSYASEGDIVVLALESGFLTSEEGGRIKSLGLGLALDADDLHMAAGSPVFEQKVGFREFINYGRPGAHYVATYSGKLIMGRPMYRYTSEDYRYGGRLETDVQSAFKSPAGPGGGGGISTEGKAFLEQVSAFGEDHGIRVVYSLPWQLTQSEFLESNRHHNRIFLDQIAQIMPVLEDPILGAHPDSSLFSDTLYHLTGDGARQRSEIVAKGLSALLNVD